MRLIRDIDIEIFFIKIAERVVVGFSHGDRLDSEIMRGDVTIAVFGQQDQDALNHQIAHDQNSDPNKICRAFIHRLNIGRCGNASQGRLR